jgi:small subunit ribosomal protein S8
MQDPISDMLTRIRNANTAKLDTVEIPSSKVKVAIAEVLKTEGFILDCTVEGEGIEKTLVIKNKYYNGESVIDGIKRVSKPSCRIYSGAQEVPRVRNGQGIAVLSTPQGIISGRTAAKNNVGGELLCYVW